MRQENVSKKRNFSNFLTAYFDYAKDGFCPDYFHMWTGLSILAACIERKIWMKQILKSGASQVYYPNIYTFLVSHPGAGKSTAIERGVELIEELKVRQPEFKIIPTQITEPALVDLMNIRQSIQMGSTISFHSSGFFYASEASESALQNLYGSFTATLTGFYDCPKQFRKKIKGESKTSEISNVCFNLLAGTTFDYLKTLVNENSVMGGFSSRIIYVIHKERPIRESEWLIEPTKSSVNSEMQEKLIEDMLWINGLTGQMKPTPGFIREWKLAQPEFDRYLISLNSPRMESLMARKFTATMKVAMLLSVSEGDDLIMTEDHWHRSVEMINAVTKDNASILTSAIIGNKNQQDGLNLYILNVLKDAKEEIPLRKLRERIMRYGADPAKINITLDSLRDVGAIGYDTRSGENYVSLLVDPDTYL